ncbi:MAG: hypothetical protein AAF654_00870 [Myxococcota bacterium]
MKYSIAALALLTCACGEITNEDLVFLAAIPSAEELEIIVEDDQTQAVAGLVQQTQLGEVSEIYLVLDQVADDVNFQVESILEFANSLFRASSPSAREEDRRIWQAPLNDTTLARLEISRVSQAGTAPVYTFCLHGILRATPRTGDPVCVNDRAVTDGSNGWRAVFYGEFAPDNAMEGIRSGTGSITLDFEAGRPVGLADPGDDGRLAIDYTIESGSDRRDLSLFLTPPESPLPGKDTFVWEYALDENDDVSFVLEIDENAENTNEQVRELLVIDSCWNLNGPGRADLSFTMGDIPPTSTVAALECWDTSQIRTFQRFQVGDTIFSAGEASSCPAACAQ